VPTAVPQQTYVVQEGDTLSSIAQRYGVSVQALQTANGISDPDALLVGQVLVIP
jgi:stage VI sporulation protein D